MEARDELAGMHFWDGDPTARVFAADAEHNAMLLERCSPGTTLRQRPESEQDEVIATLLRRMWRPPPTSGVFRPLTVMLDDWCSDLRGCTAHLPDAALANEGLDAVDRLLASSPVGLVLATDLHAGNVLAAQRQPWLVIDPKPFVGDPAYDATQHLINCDARVSADPLGITQRFGTLLGLDVARVRTWMFARLATTQSSDLWVRVARVLAR